MLSNVSPATDPREGAATDANAHARARLGITVSEVGLGRMGMSQSCGTPGDAESVATSHRAPDLSGAAAADLRLAPGDLAALESAVPRDAAAGERYPAEFMARIGR